MVLLVVVLVIVAMLRCSIFIIIDAHVICILRGRLSVARGPAGLRLRTARAWGPARYTMLRFLLLFRSGVHAFQAPVKVVDLMNVPVSENASPADAKNSTVLAVAVALRRHTASALAKGRW